MSQTDDDLLRQVEEELRRERLEKIWKQYGTYIFAVAALIVVGVGGYKVWEGRRVAAAQAAGEAYESAVLLLREKKEGSAAEEFKKLAADGSAGYSALAQLQLAGLKAKQGNKADALATYDALAASSNGDVMLRDFARLQAAGLRVGEVDFTEVENRLTPLMSDTSPWRYSARELLGLAAFKAGKTNEARTILTPLFVDQQTPQSIAERAQIIMAEIATGELAKKSAEAPAPQAGEQKPAPAAAPAPEAAAPADKKN
jgi:hypothetical protein